MHLGTRTDWSSRILRHTPRTGIYNCIEHDNLTRCWQVHVPENLDPNVTVPLIIDMHGYASNSIEHRKLSSFDDIADDEGAIVVYPDGVAGYNMQWDPDENQAWNSGWCCAHSTRDEIDLSLIHI